MNRTILIIIGILCAVIRAYVWHYSPIKTLRRQLYDKDPEVIYNAAIKLHSLGAKAAIPEFTRLLKSNNMFARVLAIESLGMLGAKETIPELIKLLKDDERDVRNSAVLALKSLGAKELIPELTKLLQDKDQQTRIWAVAQLGYCNAKESIPDIKKLLNDKDEWVRIPAELALKDLGVFDSEIQKAKENK